MGPTESLRREEEDDEVKSSIQVQMADMQGREDGEKNKAPKPWTRNLRTYAR